MTTKDPAFEVIPAEERPVPVRGRSASLFARALRDGKTLWLPGKDRGHVQGYYSYFRRDPGARFHVARSTRDGIEGVVVWLTREPPI